MDKKDIFVNTLVFLKEHQEGKKQLEMLQELHKIGIERIEVRREFFQDIREESKVIGEEARRLGLTIYYSIPESLYIDKVLQRNALQEYFEEAVLLSARQIKLVIGDYQEVTQEDVIFLNGLCEEHDVLLTVENDQTSDNGRSEKIANFLAQYKAKNGKIGFTFDIGNFLWVGEDIVKNAKELAPYVTYVHLKNVTTTPTLQTVYLQEKGIDWRGALEELPKNCPVAIEYPCHDNAIEKLQAEIEVLCNQK